MNNIGLMLVSPLFLDLSDSIKVETEALLTRNRRLGALAQRKDCPAETIAPLLGPQAPDATAQRAAPP